MYLPLNNVLETKYYFRISARLCFLTVSIPLVAFLSCVLLTMLKDFEKANKTHCNVPNIFPSISASVGSFEPQSTIWKFAIYMHSPLRFYIVSLRWKYYKKVIRSDYVFLVNLAVTLNILENFSLLGLTHWTSTENYPYHEMCFKTFIGTSVFYMLFTCIMLSNCRRRPNLTNKEKHSVKLKWRAFCVNITSFGCVAIFFIRHNRLCEPYVYSMFSFSEYIVVISNILFHLTTRYDLEIKYIYFTKHGLVTD